MDDGEDARATHEEREELERAVSMRMAATAWRRTSASYCMLWSSWLGLLWLGEEEEGEGKLWMSLVSGKAE